MWESRFGDFQGLWETLENLLLVFLGVCPGQQDSAGKSTSEQSPKGNRTMRRILDQALAAVKKKGSFFQSLYRRLLPRLGSKRPSGLSPIDSAVCCGRFCTNTSVTSRKAPVSAIHKR